MANTSVSINRKRKTLQDFFVPIPKKVCLDESTNKNAESPRKVVEGALENLENVDPLCHYNEEEIDENRLSKSAAPQLDIGNYIGKKIDDLMKRNIILNHWTPPSNYKFPSSTHNKQGRLECRYASHKHLEVKPWLVLSDVKQGYFCKYCPFFVPHGEGGFQKNVTLGRLVSVPVTSFAKLFGKKGVLDVHENSVYHRNAVQDARNFLTNENQKENSVINQLDSARMKQIRENRSRLLPIVETVIFLGRQNIAFRGHRDDGALDEGISPVSNEGNFRELLRFRVQSGDDILRQHLGTSSLRATYISKTMQNQLIENCGQEVTKTIIRRVQEAKYYSVMFDETTDIANISQMTLVLRYIYQNKVREDFVKFLDLYSIIGNDNDEGTLKSEPKLTGQKLGNIVLETLRKLDLDIKDCVGISTDGCAVMVSQMRGAVATIQKTAVNSVHCPCYNHITNLAISRSSRVQSIRNAVGTMKEAISFFSSSAKRTTVLSEKLGRKMVKLCETRWIERHDAVIQFRTSLGKIVSALETISTWQDPQTASAARMLCTALCDSQFLVSMVCLADILETTLPLSRYFQKPEVDIKCAQEILNDTVNILDKKRKMCDENFKNLFEEICVIAENDLETEITIPRRASRQINRENYPTNDRCDYYRQSVYIPLLENVLEDLRSRFSQETLQLYNLNILFPTSDSDNTDGKILEIAKKYTNLFNEPLEMLRRNIKVELELWRLKWSREQICEPRSAVDLLDFCDSVMYPHLSCLLKILATMPVSVASAERTFSTLRRLKTWLRSTMGEDRLVGLALLNVHRDINVDPNEVIDRFARSHKNHRMEFLL